MYINLAYLSVHCLGLHTYLFTVQSGPIPTLIIELDERCIMIYNKQFERGHHLNEMISRDIGVLMFIILKSTRFHTTEKG